jgi:hypothetical protein
MEVDEQELERRRKRAERFKLVDPRLEVQTSACSLAVHM